MDRATKLALIWKHTHRDYKGKVHGVKYVLVLRKGGTQTVPLATLTDAEIDRLMPRPSLER